MNQLLVLLLGCVCAASAFLTQPLPVHSRWSLNRNSKVLRLSANVCSNANVRQKEHNRGISNFGSSLVGGIFTGLLLLSPALDFTHNGAIIDGGAAYAQGATSSKSTKAAPSVDANKDPESILRFSLPIANPNNVIRDAQEALEMNMDKALREVKSEKWGKVASLSRKSLAVIAKQRAAILQDIPAEKTAQADRILDEIEASFEGLSSAIENKDVASITEKKRVVLNLIGDVEQLMVKAFPYEIPAQYKNLPQLKGRATVELTLKKADPQAKYFVDGTTYDEVKLKMVVDGYSAPITAGNFVDLVERGFYTKMAIQRSDGFVIQTGDPAPDSGPGVRGLEEGGKVRTIPLEILPLGDKEPTYGVTLEDDGRYTAQPTLPFSVYGTVAMARTEDDADSATSQFFFLLFDPELVTAGRNLMDGRYGTFGYVTEGNRLLSNVEVGDVIVDAKVIQGAENLVRPKS